jgi:hypothetical protein
MPWAQLEDDYFRNRKVIELGKDATLIDHRRQVVRADLQRLDRAQIESLAQPLADQAFAGRLDARSIGPLLIVLGELLLREPAR